MILGVKIDRAVPLAARQRDSPASGAWKDVLLEMQVGDSFEVPQEYRVAIHKAARKLRFLVTMPKGSRIGTIRVWRVA